MKVQQTLVLFKKLFIVITLLHCSGISFIVSANPNPNPNSNEQVEKCKQHQNSMQRLQCYDQLFGTLAIDNVATKKVIVKSEKQTKQTEDLGKKYLSTAVKETTPVYMSLINFTKNKYSRYVFYFENGQVWQQLEPSYIAKPKTFPVSANLSVGALGSYNLRLGDKLRKIKVKRVK